jgi:hypothetical protein
LQLDNTRYYACEIMLQLQKKHAEASGAAAQQTLGRLDRTNIQLLGLLFLPFRI